MQSKKEGPKPTNAKKRRMIKRRQEFKYTTEKAQKLRTEAFEQQKGLCYWCEEPMLDVHGRDVDRNPLMSTADRLDSRLPYMKGNIVAACYGCNTGRANSPGFYEWLDYKKKKKAS